MGKKNRYISPKELRRLNQQHDSRISAEDNKTARKTHNSFYTVSDRETMRESKGTGWAKRQAGPQPTDYSEELIREKRDYYRNKNK
jgi:hypothetical protein